MNNPPLLSAQDVYKSYGDGLVQALNSTSLCIERGEYLGIMGPSGSGKSTLLNVLGALDRPDRGEIYFDGRPLSKVRNLRQFRARELGFVFQSFLLLPTLTALENIQVPMFGGPLSRSARVRKAWDLLRAVKLAHRAKHLPNQLSVGERQRVAIARALANDPKLVLADEPTGNLDSHSAREVLDLFEEIREQRDLTLVVVTHSMALARRAQRTVCLLDGRISAFEPEEVPAAAEE